MILGCFRNQSFLLWNTLPSQRYRSDPYSLSSPEEQCPGCCPPRSSFPPAGAHHSPQLQQDQTCSSMNEFLPHDWLETDLVSHSCIREGKGGFLVELFLKSTCTKKQVFNTNESVLVTEAFGVGRTEEIQKYYLPGRSYQIWFQI